MRIRKPIVVKCNEPEVYCPNCYYFGQDCDPDEEDWQEPCESFEPVEEDKAATG